ncbi:MAG: 3'-5' exonuclease [Ruminococcaceae bacterium]|nr:3'-5' exonuclease [Oscillospiraceae bacterium]
METTLDMSPGLSIPRVTAEEADRRRYLSRALLDRMHLSPVGDPVAYDVAEDGSITYYYDPARVTETPPEQWYRGTVEKNTEEEEAPAPRQLRDPLTLPSGTIIEKMGAKRAASFGYYTAERLNQLNYDAGAEPAAYNIKPDGSTVYFYDKRAAIRRPLKCVVCGQDVRYKRKMCRACFEKDLAERRAEGDAYRAKPRHMDRRRVLFFDLELTGVYDHDEIISVSICDGTGETLMDTLVKPRHKKKWNRTEKIHGISPAMVQDAPYLDELVPAIKEMFANADNIVAFGVSTDYSHIKYIYETEREQEELHRKVRCCAIEFVRFQNEHYPDNNHASLIDAMETLGIAWDGIPHSSMADTIACMKVWEALFPNYYDDVVPFEVAAEQEESHV